MTSIDDSSYFNQFSTNKSIAQCMSPINILLYDQGSQIKLEVEDNADQTNKIDHNIICSKPSPTNDLWLNCPLSPRSPRYYPVLINTTPLSLNKRFAFETFDKTENTNKLDDNKNNHIRDKSKLLKENSAPIVNKSTVLSNSNRTTRQVKSARLSIYEDNDKKSLLEDDGDHAMKICRFLTTYLDESIELDINSYNDYTLQLKVSMEDTLITDDFVTTSKNKNNNLKLSIKKEKNKNKKAINNASKKRKLLSPSQTCDDNNNKDSTITQPLKKKKNTTDRKHRCHVCEKLFSRKSNLAAHLRIHTGEAPFVCNHCGKAFKQNSNLKRHIQIHSRSDNKFNSVPDKIPLRSSQTSLASLSLSQSNIKNKSSPPKKKISSRV